MAESAVFVWEGTDKQGRKTKGEIGEPESSDREGRASPSGNQRDTRAEKVRAGWPPRRSRRRNNAWRHRAFHTPDGDHDARRRAARAGVRGRRRRPRQTEDARPRARDQSRRIGWYRVRFGHPQAPEVLRPSVLQSRRSRRAVWLARDHARPHRDLQRKDRVVEGEGPQGDDLSGRGARRRDHRVGYSA